MRQHIRKVVFPVAGLGTRFLPATKIVPKELLPVGDRPLIQWAVEEAAAAGCSEFIFVTSPHKNAITAHFEPAPHLEKNLVARDHQIELDKLKAGLPEGAKITEVRQGNPLGLGHAIWCARDAVGKEAFAVILPDDLVQNKTGCLSQMLHAHATTGGNMVAVEEIARAASDQYGIVDPGVSAASDAAIVPIQGLVEKPAPADAPSQLAIIGRYILQPEIFDVLAAFKQGAGQEIQLTDAIADMMGTTPASGFRFQGKRFDCGSQNGYLAANLAVALAGPKTAELDELRAKIQLIVANSA